MFKVECEGCKAPYQVDERRVPPTGLRMRCPQCGTSFMVQRSDDAAGGAGSDADAGLPAAVAPKGPGTKPERVGPPPPPVKPAPPIADLPAALGGRVPARPLGPPPGA